MGEDVSIEDILKSARKPEKEGERFHLVYRHSTSDKYVMLCDGRFSSVGEKTKDGYKEVDRRSMDCGVYAPDSLEKVWKKLTGKSLCIERLKDMSKYYFEFDEVRELLKKHKTGMEDAKKAGLTYSSEFAELLYYGMGRMFYGESFWRIYKDALGDSHNWMDWTNDKFKCVYWMMFSTNRLFMPIFSGPQCGEMDCEIEMNNIINKRVKEEKKRWNDEEDED